MRIAFGRHRGARLDNDWKENSFQLENPKHFTYLLFHHSFVELEEKRRSVKTTRPGALQYSAARTDDHRRHVADSDGPDDGHLACKSDQDWWGHYLIGAVTRFQANISAPACKSNG